MLLHSNTFLFSFTKYKSYISSSVSSAPELKLSSKNLAIFSLFPVKLTTGHPPEGPLSTITFTSTCFAKSPNHLVTLSIISFFVPYVLVKSSLA